jgi:hypothetical protein
MVSDWLVFSCTFQVTRGVVAIRSKPPAPVVATA